MIQQIIIAGFGGQGIMSMGQLLAYAGMKEGKQVAWIPSYGPEMRGGTANCSVIISEWKISSPIVTEPNVAMVMNRPSLEKFAPKLVSGGALLVNSSLVGQKPVRTDIKLYQIPANHLADGLNNPRVANMVMLGVYIELTRTVSQEAILASLRKILPPSRQHLIELNQQALEIGRKLQQKRIKLEGVS